MPKTWLTADLHFGHKNILKYENRPFETVEEMDERLVRKWNQKVEKDDIVFILGDLFLTSAKRAEVIAKRLNGHKHIVLGNHDTFTETKYLKMGFKPHKMYILENYLLTHHPQSVEALKTAKNYGFIERNIHGHVHSNIGSLDPSVHLCVSVELTNYSPVSFDFIKNKKLT